LQESTTREVTLDQLKPYTSYIIHGAVSNFYSQYSVLSLGNKTYIRTAPGGKLSMSISTKNIKLVVSLLALCFAV